jgi:serine/threonine-protein kinase
MTWDQLESLFLEVLALEREERARRLAREPDVAMRREVLAMLAAHEGDGLDIERRLLAAEDAPGDITGTRIGPYRVIELIGRGGMGAVYLARRDDDLYERDVAIKLVQPGYRPALHERFARERAILARLSHANVATLYDGGVTDDGTPYLVMEYVEGEPITDFCDAGQLDIDCRLALFLRVCEAVQSAHAALIIHRDLKPSNILVDRHSNPKLLDFGIARLLEEENNADDAQAHTQARTTFLDRVLTPEHAAPEQIRGEDPTTATDVYGLGVLLCELLVGDRPIHFPSRSPTEIERIARQVEPQPPSTLLSRLDAATRNACARARRTSVAALRSRLRGDLDAICLKALRKEPEQRYSSVAELVADLQRHLDQRPVHAVRETRSYVARKFLRRHRTSLTLSAVAFAMLAGFLVIALMQASQVREQRDRARLESARAERVLDRLVDLFESTSPQATGQEDLLDVGDFLQRGEETAALLEGDPPAQAKMFEILAGIHANRGELERAIILMQRARDGHVAAREQLRLDQEIALLRTRHEGHAVGLPLLRATLTRWSAMLGPEHPSTLRARLDLGQSVQDPDEARALLEPALQRFVAPTNDDEERARAEALNALALVEIGDAAFASAAQRLREADSLLARSLSATSGARITVRHNLAAACTRMGQWDEAAEIQRQLLAARRRISGSHSDLTANVLESYAVTLAHLGRHREAAERFAEALAIFEDVLTPDHWRIANAERNVGQLLSLQGRYAEALPHFDRAIALNRSGGRDNAHQRGQRAVVLLGLGHTQEAVTTLQDILAAWEARDVAINPSYRADALVWLGLAHLQSGRNGAARTCFEQARDIRATIFDAGHPKVAEAACGVAVARGSVDAAAFEGYRAWGLAHPLLLSTLPAGDRSPSSTAEGPR